MPGIKEFCGAGAFCAVIWMPLICFSIALTGHYYTLVPSNCSPLVLKGHLPKPAQQYYGLTNVTAAPWYFGEWRVMSTRGVCPLQARSAVTTSKTTGHGTPGEFLNCLPFSNSKPWQLMDQYNSPATTPTMVDSAIALEAAYHSLLASIVISLGLIGVSCTNVFLSMNSSSGRHSWFSLFLLLEIIFYLLVFILSSIVVGSADSSSIATSDGWASWFPKCTVNINPLDIPGLMIWLLDLGLFILTLLVIGELTHKYAGGCLTRYLGPTYQDSGFTKTLADVRTRWMRVVFYGAEPTGLQDREDSHIQERQDTKPSTGAGGVDVIPRRVKV